MIPFYPSKFRSHLLILVCVIVSFIAWYGIPSLQWYGMIRTALYRGEYFYFLMQLSFYQFLHVDFLHLLMNSLFLYQMGGDIESRMKKDEFVAFFLGNTLFVALCLLTFNPYDLTMGISGFATAILAYLYIDLRSVNHPISWQLWFWLFLNIAIGLSAHISLVWHASWAVFGILWWYMKKRIF